MAHKLFSLVLMLVLALPVVIFAFAGNESKAPAPAEVMQKQIADAIKVYGEKKEVYRKDVLDLFERKEKNARDKGDLKTLNLIKKERAIFSEDAKEPTLFLITDQKRFLELAKLDLIKAYEKTIKDCLKMKLDEEAEGFSKELEEIRTGKIKDEEKKVKRISLQVPFSAEAAKNAQKELAKSLGKLIEAKIDLGKGVKLEMVLIPAGKFMMGSPASEVGRRENETQHEVTLTKPFYVGKYEVTQEQWQIIMGSNSSETKGARFPINKVSWNDCQDFIKKLNTKTNGGYRLPTEAEWEYACRAGSKTVYSFGDSITKGDANYGDGAADRESIKATGNYKPNAFGLYDMHGNVWEWCEDWKADYPGGAVTDPKGPATGEYRVLRGGSFFNVGSFARSAFRFNVMPAGRGNSGGFRLARTADNKVETVSLEPKPDLAEIMPGARVLVAPFDETKAKQVQKSVAKSLQKEVEEKADLGKGINLEMVLIPAGKFMMGSPAFEKGRRDKEKQHQVTLTKPFYMGKYEVTQEQWEAVMGNNPSIKTKGAKLPVTDVSWEDCQDFIKKLNAKTNGGYRLPPEAEWEYACRAGTTTAYSFGNEITPNDATYSASKPVPVGSYKPNAFGLYDMHGNVWEWCDDWYGDYPAGAVTDPKGPAEGGGPVLRGGAFGWNSSDVRSSERRGIPLTVRSFEGGFRLAKTVDMKAAVAPAIPNPKPAEIIPAVENLLLAPFSAGEAKTAQMGLAKSLGKVMESKIDLGKGINLEMVLIPAGKFMMGSPASEKGRREKEKQHEVTLTKPFYMGKYEVTQEQWEAVMANNPSSKTKGAKLPVTDVLWEDCQDFIKKLNAKTSGGYRLPSEAEWEYACRAGTSTVYAFGDSLTNSDANFGGSSTKAVGGYKPNAFGLYDMHGNVWEWCEDRYADYQAGAVTDPKGAETGTNRVLRGVRGGSFADDWSAARSSYRNFYSPTLRTGDTGFRLAKTP